MQKFKIHKNQISKNANRKKQNLENFHHNFFRKIDREIVFPQDRVLVLKITAKSLLRDLAPFAMCEVNI